ELVRVPDLRELEEGRLNFLGGRLLRDAEHLEVVLRLDLLGFLEDSPAQRLELRREDLPFRGGRRRRLRLRWRGGWDRGGGASQRGCGRGRRRRLRRRLGLPGRRLSVRLILRRELRDRLLHLLGRNRSQRRARNPLIAAPYPGRALFL